MTNLRKTMMIYTKMILVHLSMYKG